MPLQPYITDSKFTRLPEWETKFYEWAENAMRTPFKWGEFDCGLMAADAVKAITGEDPAEDLRGAYSTEEEAELIIGSADGLRFSGLLDVGDERFGNRSPAGRSRRGDIVLIQVSKDGEECLSMAVETGTHFLVTGARGAKMVAHRVVDTLYCWRIG